MKTIKLFFVLCLVPLIVQPVSAAEVAAEPATRQVRLEVAAQAGDIEVLNRFLAESPSNEGSAAFSEWERNPDSPDQKLKKHLAYIAARHGHTAAVQALIPHIWTYSRVKGDAAFDEEFYDHLAREAIEGMKRTWHWALVVDILEKSPDSVHVRNAAGETLMTVAAGQGVLPTQKFLLELLSPTVTKGTMSIGAEDAYGETAESCAHAAGHAEMVTMLRTVPAQQKAVWLNDRFAQAVWNSDFAEALHHEKVGADRAARNLAGKTIDERLQEYEDDQRRDNSGQLPMSVSYELGRARQFLSLSKDARAEQHAFNLERFTQQYNKEAEATRKMEAEREARTRQRLRQEDALRTKRQVGGAGPDSQLYDAEEAAAIAKWNWEPPTKSFGDHGLSNVRARAGAAVSAGAGAGPDSQMYDGNEEEAAAIKNWNWEPPTNSFGDHGLSSVQAGTGATASAGAGASVYAKATPDFAKASTDRPDKGAGAAAPRPDSWLKKAYNSEFLQAAAVLASAAAWQYAKSEQHKKWAKIGAAASALWLLLPKNQGKGKKG